ncbi:hypothetical protein LZK76_22385 [Rhizobium leguminosarum]|nr:hypothetical protein LZK76_22385 [Rhizobium leguminosarum]
MLVITFKSSFDFHGPPEGVVIDLYGLQEAEARAARHAFVGKERVVGDDNIGGRDRLALHGHVVLRVADRSFGHIRDDAPFRFGRHGGDAQLKPIDRILELLLRRFVNLIAHIALQFALKLRVRHIVCGRFPAVLALAFDLIGLSRRLDFALNSGVGADPAPVSAQEISMPATASAAPIMAS